MDLLEYCPVCKQGYWGMWHIVNEDNKAIKCCKTCFDQHGLKANLVAYEIKKKKAAEERKKHNDSVIKDYKLKAKKT